MIMFTRRVICFKYSKTHILKRQMNNVHISSVSLFHDVLSMHELKKPVIFHMLLKTTNKLMYLKLNENI